MRHNGLPHMFDVIGLWVREGEERGPAVPSVNAQGLSCLMFVADQIQEIIVCLIRKTERESEPCKRCHQGIVVRREQGTDRRARLQETGRFAFDHPAMTFVLLERIGRGSDIRTLPFAEVEKGGGEHSENPVFSWMVDGLDEPEGKCNQRIARQYCDRCPVPAIDRRYTTAGVALVHDVIVHKTGRMKQFERTAGGKCIILVPACGGAGQCGKHRTDELPPKGSVFDHPAQKHRFNIGDCVPQIFFNGERERLLPQKMSCRSGHVVFLKNICLSQRGSWETPCCSLCTWTPGPGRRMRSP